MLFFVFFSSFLSPARVRVWANWLERTIYTRLNCWIRRTLKFVRSVRAGCERAHTTSCKQRIRLHKHYCWSVRTRCVILQRILFAWTRRQCGRCAPEADKRRENERGERTNVVVVVVSLARWICRAHFAHDSCTALALAFFSFVFASFFLHNKFTCTRFLHLPRLHFSSFTIIKWLSLPNRERERAERPLARAHQCCTYTPRQHGNRRINYNFQNFSECIRRLASVSAGRLCVSASLSVARTHVHTKFETNEKLIKNFSFRTRKVSFFGSFCFTPLLLSLSLCLSFHFTSIEYFDVGKIYACIDQIFFFFSNRLFYLFSFLNYDFFFVALLQILLLFRSPR